MNPLLPRLLARGDTVSIDRGILRISPASGIPVPDDWLADNRLRLCQEILRATGKDALEYVGYDTGHYGRSRAGGVTLQFVSVVTGEEAYAIFNADLTRARSVGGKPAGSPLPKGEFRAGKRSAFYKFWLTTGLNIPNRLSKFHKHMGTIKRVLLTGLKTGPGNRLDVKTMEPVEIQADQIWMAVMGDKLGTAEGRVRDKEGTNSRDKETPQRQQPQALPPNPTTCVSNHGNTVIREDGYTVALPSLNTGPAASEVDAWLDEYDRAESLH